MAYRDDYVVITLDLPGEGVIYRPCPLADAPGSSGIQVFPYIDPTSPTTRAVFKRWLLGEFYVVQLTQGVPIERPYSPAEEAPLFYASFLVSYPETDPFPFISRYASNYTYTWADMYIAAWSTPGLRGLRLEVSVINTGA